MEKRVERKTEREVGIDGWMESEKSRWRYSGREIMYERERKREREIQYEREIRYERER